MQLNPRQSDQSPEAALHALDARCERQAQQLESLTTQHETTLKERAVLRHIVRREQLNSCGKGLRKGIIRWQDVRSFMEHASHMFDRLQRLLRISLRYAWFCRWLCAKYIFCRRHAGGGVDGGDGGDVLSPHTVLSYFKRERAGG